MSYVQEAYIAFETHVFRATDYTSEKNSHAYRDFWSLLISSGIKFGRDDFLALREWEDFDYYNHFYEPYEGLYGLAIQESNMSFVHAYEKYKNRKPFITKNIDYGYHRRGFVCHGNSKTQGRLIIGASFNWGGRRVTVTSFKDDAHALIACEYQPKKDGPAKIKKRFTITVDELRKSKKEK